MDDIQSAPEHIVTLDAPLIPTDSPLERSWNSNDLSNDEFHRESSSSEEDSQKALETFKISFFRKVVAGGGHILNDLCASVWFTYLILYFEYVAGFSKEVAAGLMLLGQVADAVTTPLIGYEADRTNDCWICKKGYGRCKAWHLVGVVLVLSSFVFVFSKCYACDENTTEVARAIYYAPFIVIFQMGWACSQISHLALVPKISPDELVRTELLAIRYAFTVGSNIAVFLLIWFLLGLNHKNCEVNESYEGTFWNLALCCIGIGGFFSLLFHIVVREKSDEEVKKASLALERALLAKESNVRRKRVISLETVTNVRSVTSSMTISKVHAKARRRRQSGISGSSQDTEVVRSLLQDEMDLSTSTTHDEPIIAIVGDQTQQNTHQTLNNPQAGGTAGMAALSLGKESMSLMDWLTLPQFYIVAVLYMATRLCVNVTQVYIPLYVKNDLQLPCSYLAVIPLVMYCSGFCIAIVIKLINKCLGRQIAYCLGAVLGLVAAGLILFLDWQPGSTLSKYGIYGVGVLLGGGASATLVTSLSITADLIGNNIENGAFVYGFMSFCDKLSCGLVIMLINSLLSKNATYQYQKVLGYTTAGTTITGMIAVFGLTYIIYKQNKSRQ